MRIKKKMTWLMALVMILTLIAAGCGGGQSKPAEQQQPAPEKKVVELKFHHHDPPTSAAGKFFEKWCKEIEDASNGTLKITVYHGGALGSPKDTYDMVVNGTVDMAWGVTAYFPGRFDMTDVFNLPLLGIETAEEGSQIYWDLFTKTDYLKKEYEPFKVLFLHCHADVPVALKNKKITTTADLKGAKIRVAGSSPTEFFKAVGASPIAMPATDVYTSMEKGVLDGIAADWHLLKSFKIIEQAKEYLDARLYTGPLFCVMNKQKYESLPPDAKKAIDEKAGQYAVAAAGKNWQDTRDETIELIKANKGNVSEMTPELKAAFEKAAQTAWDVWIKAGEAKGLPAQKVFDFVKAEAAKK